MALISYAASPWFGVEAFRATRYSQQASSVAAVLPKGIGIAIGLHLRQRNLRIRPLHCFAASHGDSKAADVEIEQEKEHQGWPQIFAASFKEHALNKMKSVIKEAYDLYYEKAALILIEIAGESKPYLLRASAAVNPPEPVKDIVETFSSSTTYDQFNDFSKLPHFYVGIPYGVFLSVGGFLSFMLTGSISAIRFGMILGGTLLALSISSLRSWKKGDQCSALALKGLTAIATILFLREFQIFLKRPSLANSVITLVSGGVAAFYLYRIIGGEEGQSMNMTLSNSK